MALSAETQAWLDELKKTGGITDEAYTSLKSTFEGNNKADEYLKGSVLRQSDYSRQMADIQKAKKEVEDSTNALKQREADVTKFQGELSQWKAGAETNYRKALDEHEKAERKATAAVARLRSLAMANGMDEAEVLKDIDVLPAKKEEPVKTSDIDTSKFLTREDLAKGIGESALVDAAIYDIASEYQELTGKSLRGAALLVQEAIKAGKTLQTYADEKFGLPKLREEKAAKDKADYEKSIRDDERAKVLSEGLIPGNIAPGRGDLQGSPVLRKEGIPEPGKGNGIEAATAAFQAGKYRINPLGR